MESRRLRTSSKWLSLVLATFIYESLIVLPATPYAAPRTPVGFLFEVNTTGDGDRVSGGAICDADAATPGDQCTLRAAIQASNDNAGDDGIQIDIPASDPGCDAATARCTISLQHALPDLSTNVSISGPGADRLTVRRSDSAAGFRIFNVTTTGAVTLSGMTVSNGRALGGLHGGGIHNASTGTVNVQQCAVTDNEATEGGGIGNFSAGTVNVSQSLLSNNVARGAPSTCCSTGAGGGLSNTSSGSVNVVNSTIAGNFAIGADGGSPPAGPGPGQGGGIYNSTGSLNITNSTIANNLSTGTEGQLSRGGGVFSQSGIVNLKSSIVANNTSQASGNDLSGPVTSHGFNLVQDPSDSSIIQQSSDLFGIVPKLGQLGNRGGPTQTMELLAGSPAIDKGTSAGLTGPLSTDQRGAGFPRVVNDPAIPNASGGDGTDIGAFEVQPTVRFSVAAYNVSESGGQATITVRRTALNNQTATVRFATSNGTATAGKDYTAKSGMLTFAANETTKTFTVAITDDAMDEANETINLTLGSPTGGMTLGTPNKAVLTIADNDSSPALSVGNVTLTEGSSGALYATFNVTLSAPSGKTVTVKYATANATATAPADYEARAGTLSFAPGQTSRTLTVGVRGDTLDEANETFLVNLSTPLNATIADAQGIGTITDNDPVPGLSIGNVTVTEVDAGTVNATLTVKLSAASGKGVTVNYATANGTASSSGDYVAKSGTLSFAAGQTTATIVVQVRGDLLKEANETFFVNLSAPVNATLADGQGQVTILNDD